MPPQFLVNLIVGLTGFAIPMIVLFVALKQTGPHGFSCTRCDHDIPLGSARCPHCNAPAANLDQPL